MKRPDIDMIKECLPLVDERIAKSTVTYLVEYIEYLENLSNQEEGESEKWN